MIFEHTHAHVNTLINMPHISNRVHAGKRIKESFIDSFGQSGLCFSKYVFRKHKTVPGRRFKSSKLTVRKAFLSPRAQRFLVGIGSNRAKKKLGYSFYRHQSARSTDRMKNHFTINRGSFVQLILTDHFRHDIFIDFGHIFSLNRAQHCALLDLEENCKKK